MSSHKSQLLPALGVWTEALVVSADYRLAPEHKLQAQALGDCDGWLDTCEVDFKLMGCQYHTPLGCKALSRIRCINGSSLCSRICAVGTVFRWCCEDNVREGPERGCAQLGDTRQRLSLLAPDAKPFGPMSPRLGAVNLDPILVVVGGCELLKDRARDYFKRLKAIKKGIQ